MGKDIAFVVGTVSCYMSNHGKEHWATVECIYADTSKVLRVYALDMARETHARRLHGFTSGYVMTYAGGAVSWQSRLQKTVSLSTT